MKFLRKAACFFKGHTYESMKGTYRVFGGPIINGNEMSKIYSCDNASVVWCTRCLKSTWSFK